MHCSGSLGSGRTCKPQAQLLRDRNNRAEIVVRMRRRLGLAPGIARPRKLGFDLSKSTMITAGPGGLPPQAGMTANAPPGCLAPDTAASLSWDDDGLKSRRKTSIPGGGVADR